MALSSELKEVHRRHILGILCRTPTKGMSVPAVRLMLRIRKELPEEVFGSDESDINEALHFLKGLGFVRDSYVEMGSTLIWKPTSDGILFHERNAL